MNWERMNTGQIRLYQRLGYWIQSYAKNTDFQRYLEIGSWNGRGSTVCFAAGLYDRNPTSFTFQSLEINASRVQESIECWKGFPFVKIVHGRILPELPDIRSIHTSIVNDWQLDDEQHFFTAPFVDVGSPDVVLLDGGEYLTYFEYKLLKQSAKVFLLDDTNVAKCSRIVVELLADPEWYLVEKGDDRNGWAVFQRHQNISKNAVYLSSLQTNEDTSSSENTHGN